MFVPALSALIVAKIFKDKVVPYGWHLGGAKPYILVFIFTPIVFALVYGLTILLGLGSLDLGLSTFISMVERSTGQKLPPIDPAQFITTVLVASVTFAPFINSFAALGEEIGWRGYLLPRLVPLGKVKAYPLLGVIWGLWHTPLILVGFNYPGFPIAGVFMFVLFTTALSVLMSELTLKYQSVVLAGWIHGVLNSQGLGIWRVIVPDAQPLLGGMTGLIGIAVIGAIAYLIVRFDGYRVAAEPRPNSL
jgi:membrane protease YdiL (CAAX protease family)